jgi:hypothetical protein
MKTHDQLSLKVEILWTDRNEDRNIRTHQFEDLKTAKLFGQAWATFIGHGVMVKLTAVTDVPTFFAPKGGGGERYTLIMERLGGIDEGYLKMNMRSRS